MAGALFQYLLTAWTLHGAPLLGTRVDVGGRSLHVVCRGRGTPTVFLDATALGGASQWARVQDALAAEVELCAYDRAGVGFSDPGPAPRDAAALGRDLERVAATRPPPYILGAGSSGGLAVRSYLAAHPDRVAGVLLADAFTDNFDALPRSYAKAVRSLRAAQVFSRFGVLRLANPFGIRGSVDKALFYRPQAWDAAASLVANFPSSLAQLRNAPIPPNLPLRVLTHTSAWLQRRPLSRRRGPDDS